jgi:hypothetical protein
MTGDSDKPIANPTAVLREGFDGWAVLVNMDTGASVALNPTGIAVWKLIDGKSTVEEIVQAFKAHFHFNSTTALPDRVNEDVQTLLSTLAEEGFVGYEKPLKKGEKKGS